MRNTLTLALILAASAAAMPAAAQSTAATIADRAPDTLRPGQFVWYQAPAQGMPANAAVSMTVSLSEQRAYVYRGGRLVAATTVSTGSPGRETPVGDFTILEKKAFHRSNLYSDAPMPYMQRLTWDGIALHAGRLPGHPASHGCIRLPEAFARRLFDMTERGGSVTVVDFDILDPSVDLFGPLPPLDEATLDLTKSTEATTSQPAHAAVMAL